MPGPAGRWGWHRLDPRWADRLVAAADVRPGDVVVDVGAGTGALTAALVDAGARVVAVELHPARAATLRRRFDRTQVTVVQADASDLRLPRHPFKVVANPPFAVTAALLRRVTSRPSRLQRASLVLPAWAAARWAGGRGTGAPWFAYRIDGRVPPAAFRPPPPGPASILIIERRW